jgi:hypothetical protein
MEGRKALKKGLGFGTLQAEIHLRPSSLETGKNYLSGTGYQHHTGP